MPNKTYCTWQDIQHACTEINRQIVVSGWKPSFVIGPSRGGLAIGTMMSHYFDATFFPFPHPSMPNDLTNLTALGAMVQDDDVLVIDDICDTGSSLIKIREQMEQMPYQTCKYAAIHYNIGQDQFEPDYYALEINKEDNPCWIVYPWEEWWRM